MKFFIDNQDLDKQVENVIKKIRLRMNGETSHQMQQRGIIYRTNYGAGMPHLKELAQELPTDFDLAERLWHREIRETMILAALIVPHHLMTREKCNEWAQLIPNIDLIERTTPFLFGKLEIADALSEEWLNSTNEWLIHLGCYTLGWHVQDQQTCTSADLDHFLKHISTWDDKQLVSFARSISFVLRKYIRKLKGGSPNLSAFIKQIKKSEKKQLLITAEELITELEFVSEL